MSFRVTVSELLGFYVCFAQVTVLVAPPSRNWPPLGAGWQTLVARRIVPTCTLPPTDEFQLRPDSYVAAFHNGCLSRVVVLSDRIRSLKSFFVPPPSVVKNYPDVVRLPARAEISERFSHNSWFIWYLAGQNGFSGLLVQ
jgi:hypothetical protein